MEETKRKYVERSLLFNGVGVDEKGNEVRVVLTLDDDYEPWQVYVHKGEEDKRKVELFIRPTRLRIKGVYLYRDYQKEPELVSLKRVKELGLETVVAVEKTREDPIAKKFKK